MYAWKFWIGGPAEGCSCSPSRRRLPPVQGGSCSKAYSRPRTLPLLTFRASCPPW